MRKIWLIVLALALVASGCSDSSGEADSETSDGGEAAEVTSTAGEAKDSEETSRGTDASEDDAPSFEAEMADRAPGEALTRTADEGSSDAIEAPPIDEPIEPLPDQPLPQAGVLTAAEIDDNLNFEFFKDYLGRAQQQFGQTRPAITLQDRLTLRVVGANGVGLGNARLDISSGQQSTTIFTSSAGTAYLYPTLSGLADWATLTVTATDPTTGQTQDFSINRVFESPQEASIVLPFESSEGTLPKALDVALVLDVTGSMTDELRYLTVEFESIIGRIATTYPDRDLRFGLVVYRDEGDDFVTRTFDFTDDVGLMQEQLAQQVADGGGDAPEAMDQALIEANGLSWRDGNVARVMILNADAPPHDADLQRTLEEVSIARSRGVRVYPLAASGVDDTAEYLMRVMAATTGGRHLFLTDDSGVGNAHQEPKTQCYVVTRLDQLLVRILETELAGERVEAHPDEIIRTVGSYHNGVCLPEQ